jgi:hypothetical protein
VRPSRIREITRVGGHGPVEVEGILVDGRAFYFRARFQRWAFFTAATDQEIDTNPTFEWAEAWGDEEYAASYLADETALEIIESCGDMLADGVKAPAWLGEGALEDDDDARSIARRWVAMATRADASRHEPILEEGRRWMKRWAANPTVYAAFNEGISR